MKEQVKSALGHAMQNMEPESFLRAVAEFIKYQFEGWDDAAAVELRHWLRNVDNAGRRFVIPHPSCY